MNPAWAIQKPKHNIYIIAIGAPQSGKTTFLCFLLELMFETGIDFSEARNEKRGTVVLVDNLGEEEFKNLDKTQAADRYITVRVRRKKDIISWADKVHTDLFIYNDGELKLLNHQTRDLFQAEIKNHRVWKEAFEK